MNARRAPAIYTSPQFARACRGSSDPDRWIDRSASEDCGDVGPCDYARGLCGSAVPASWDPVLSCCDHTTPMAVASAGNCQWRQDRVHRGAVGPERLPPRVGGYIVQARIYSRLCQLLVISTQRSSSCVADGRMILPPARVGCHAAPRAQPHRALSPERRSHASSCASASSSWDTPTFRNCRIRITPWPKAGASEAYAQPCGCRDPVRASFMQTECIRSRTYRHIGECAGRPPRRLTCTWSIKASSRTRGSNRHDAS